MNALPLICLIVLAGCVERALETEPSIVVTDGASSSTDAALSTHDLGTSPADMASNKGVPCAGDVCMSPDSCCWDGTTLHCSDACPPYENLD
jgi:hypothetical protein